MWMSTKISYFIDLFKGLDLFKRLLKLCVFSFVWHNWFTLVSTKQKLLYIKFKKKNLKVVAMVTAPDLSQPVQDWSRLDAWPAW